VHPMSGGPGNSLSAFFVSVGSSRWSSANITMLEERMVGLTNPYRHPRTRYLDSLHSLPRATTQRIPLDLVQL
jgi:hypothetical protein